MIDPKGLSKIIKDTEVILDKSEIKCLEFGINCAKEMGCEKEIGIKGYKFTEAGFTSGQFDRLVKLGYFSRQLIFAEVHDYQKCSLTGEQGNRNISGVYLAVTDAGLEFYKLLTRDSGRI